MKTCINQGGWGHLTGIYISTKSFINMFSYSCAIELWVGTFIESFLGAISIGSMMVPSPKIVIELSMTYDKLPSKGEPLI